VAVVHLVYLFQPLVVAEAAGAHQPLVHQAWVGLEAAAVTVVMASPSPSQAPPSHMLGEGGVQESAPQAQGEQGEGGPAVSLRCPVLLPLVLPTLVVGAGGIMPLEQQVAPAL
jgi:hypothetical protein